MCQTCSKYLLKNVRILETTIIQCSPGPPQEPPNLSLSILHTHTHTHPMHTPSYTCTHSQPLELTVHDREVIQRVRVSVLCLLVGTLAPAGGDSGLFTQLGLQVCRVVEDVWVLEQEGRMGVRKGTGGHGENGQAGSWGRGAVLRWSLTLDGGRLDPLCCCQPSLQRWE